MDITIEALFDIYCGICFTKIYKGNIILYSGTLKGVPEPYYNYDIKDANFNYKEMELIINIK